MNRIEKIIEKSNIVDSPELTELDINESSYLLCVKDNKLHKVGVDNIENKIFKQFDIHCSMSTSEKPYTEFECDYGKLVILNLVAGNEMALYFTYAPNVDDALIPLGNLDPDISSNFKVFLKDSKMKTQNNIEDTYMLVTIIG